jgi:di/tricarboxylate transporter
MLQLFPNPSTHTDKLFMLKQGQWSSIDALCNILQPYTATFYHYIVAKPFRKSYNALWMWKQKERD